VHSHAPTEAHKRKAARSLRSVSALLPISIAGAIATGCTIGWRRLHRRAELAEGASDHLVDVAAATGAHMFALRKAPDNTSSFAMLGRGLSALHGGVDRADPREAHLAVLAAIHPDDRARLLAEHSYEALRANLGCTTEIEYRVIAPEDAVRWVRVRWVSRLDGEDVVLEGVASNVTAQHELMESAQTARAQAERAADSAHTVRDEVEQLLAESSSLSAQLEHSKMQAEERAEELARSEVQLRAERDFSEALISASSEYAIISTDTEGVVQVFNSGAEKLLARSAESVIGRVSLQDLHEPGQLRHRARDCGADPGFAALVHLARDGSPDRGEWTYMRGDGSTVPVQVAIAPIPGPNGEPIGYLAVASDITVRLREEEARELHAAQLEIAASTDALTGLANRRRASSLVEQALADGSNRGRMGFVMLDVDHFKRVNDTYGHDAGDRVLREVAERLSLAARTGDLISRWGGEEFALLLHGVEDAAALQLVAERLRREVSETPIVLDDGSQLRITASAGGALAGDGATFEELLTDADRALYSAKRRGRDRLLLAHEIVGDGDEQDVDTMRLAQALALASSLREGMPDQHCRQVADLSAAIARELDLPAEMVQRCRLAGWLHDLGKLAVPDQVLCKRAALDDDEWARVRAHPAIGDMLASRIPGLDPARAGIRHHHERMDGTGYPDGLAGDAIPIEARVVGCADAYSALTGDRPYRRETGHAESLAELRRSAGTQFDPRVVDALARLLARPHADLEPVLDAAA